MDRAWQVIFKLELEADLRQAWLQAAVGDREDMLFLVGQNSFIFNFFAMQISILVVVVTDERNLFGAFYLNFYKFCLQGLVNLHKDGSVDDVTWLVVRELSLNLYLTTLEVTSRVAEIVGHSITLK